jgi:hypothetical protein
MGALFFYKKWYNPNMSYKWIKSLSICLLGLPLCGIAHVQKTNILFIGHFNFSKAQQTKAHDYILSMTPTNSSAYFFVDKPYNCGGSISMLGFLKSWLHQHQIGVIPKSGVTVNLLFSGKQKPIVASMYPLKDAAGGHWHFIATKISSPIHSHNGQLQLIMLRRHPVHNDELSELIETECQPRP